MRFAVESKFRITSDRLECNGPWVPGMVFHVLRPGSRKAKERERLRSEADPVLRRTLNKVILETIATVAKPEPKLINPSAGQVEIVGEAGEVEPPPPTFSERFDNARSEAIREALAAKEINPFDFWGGGRGGRALDDALDLLDGWTGVLDAEGQPVPFSREAARDLLACDTPVDEGHDYAGLTIGDALIKHLLEFAQGHEIARGKYLEAGAKNSEAPSTGD